MTNPFFSNTIDLLPATKARAGDVEANLTAVEAGFDEAKQYFDRTLRGARANPAISEIPDASTRANKALTFDGSGNPVATVTTTEISNAQNSATAALNSANAAAGSAASAATLLDAFDDRYLGSKSSDPTLDNDGNALLTGALYWNTVSNLIRVYSGTAWQDLQQASAFFTQAFSGNGSTTAFTLSSAPASSAAVEVFIAGVRQAPTTNYTVSGTTLTFVVAPPSGANNVFVRWISVQPMTNGQLTGNLNFSGTGLRLTGDFSNATVANRLMFQTSTTNSATLVSAIPNGTAAQANFDVYSKSDPANAARGVFAIREAGGGNDDLTIQATRTGTGNFLPMTFYTGGSERLRIDTSGNLLFTGKLIATNSVVAVQGTSTFPNTGAGWEMTANAAIGGGSNLLQSYNRDSAAFMRAAYNASEHIFYGSSTEHLRIDTSGNVLVTGSGGLGYGVGSGGQATQPTSKTSPVTLNKPFGVITMFSALGASEDVVFQVNNSLVGVDDVIALTMKTAALQAISIEADCDTAGFFRVRAKNLTGSALGVALTFKFAIIKGAGA